ncbi:macrophage colony-stimulating factor 1 receptor isoform X2 [Paramisgurnus dabryanus]|uniref:macrophage colony-stimulating factor 1 receptor isoform X2 n=1 Tax=Paramisgurnus dabryanus TaxID=90735 RepID=UPI003CCF442C
MVRSMMLLFIFVLGLLDNRVHGRSQLKITVNSDVLSGTDVILDSGSPLHLRCEGDGPVTWVPRLNKHKRYISKETGNIRSFHVDKATVEFTGTYTCSYISKDKSNESSSLHVFVRDPQDLFVSPSTPLSYVRREGEDLLLPCLLTDPNATDFTFRMDNNSALPQGMNITFDPKKGVLIRNVHPEYNAQYVCSARIRGIEKVSKTFKINVIQRLRFPPYVFLERNKYVRLVGEKLQISCTTNNPNFNYNVTWAHSSRKLPDAKEKSAMAEYQIVIMSVLTIPAVQLSDSGNITCTGQNEAGANSSTTQLLVLDEPYIRLSAKLSSKLTHNGLFIEVSDRDDVDLRVLIEAYPPLTSHWWEIPVPHNASLLEQKFYNYNDRYEALLFLKRLNFQEMGRYTLHVQSDMRNASISFDIKMYTPVGSVKVSVECISGVRWAYCSSEGNSLFFNWTLNGQPLAQDNKTTINLDGETSGNLICSVKNHISHAEKSITVNDCTVSGMFVIVWTLQMIFLLLLLGGFHIYIRKRTSTQTPGEENQEDIVLYEN